MSWVYAGMGSYGYSVYAASQGHWLHMVGWLILGTILIAQS